MSVGEMNQGQKWYGPASYRIKIKGSLSNQFSNRFDGLETHFENGFTTIEGDVVDQAALHGILNQIRNLGLQLISLERVDPNSIKQENQK